MLLQGKLSSTYTVLGHRDSGNTACPGQALYSLIRAWSRYGRRVWEDDNGFSVGNCLHQHRWRACRLFRQESPAVARKPRDAACYLPRACRVGRGSNFLNPIQSNPQWWPKCWPKSNPIHMTDRRHMWPRRPSDYIKYNIKLYIIIWMAFICIAYSQSTNASLLQYYTYYITRKMSLQKLSKRNNFSSSL